MGETVALVKMASMPTFVEIISIKNEKTRADKKL